MNVVLCGMMGCGKSTVGVCLAKKADRQFVDTDNVIVERYGKISDIFEKYGEARFRELETEVVKAVAFKNNLVLATGGGLVLKEENVDLLKKNGKIVYLRAELDTLVQRLQSDRERPLLQNGQALSERLKTLLAARADRYESIADLVVCVDEKDPEQIAQEIIERIGQV